MASHNGQMKEYKCANCKAAVGRTDGDDIYIKGVLVPGKPISLAFNCFECRAIVKWRTTRDRKELQNATR